MEKIHGTSAHITFKEIELEGIKHWKLEIFSGGEKYMNFVKLFDEEFLIRMWVSLNINTETTIYGEAYGGKQQGMSGTYGTELKFIAFDVKIGDCWLAVPQAEEICKVLGIEFVYYEKCPTHLPKLDEQRDNDSVQAVRNGIGEGKKREGVVLRPVMELTKNGGERIICKHKRDDFRETKTPRIVGNNLEILAEINNIVDEWVTDMRLSHILGKLESYSIEDTGKIIKLMQEDILREGQGEILIVENNKDLLRAIGNRTAQMYKKRIQNENLR